MLGQEDLVVLDVCLHNNLHQPEPKRFCYHTTIADFDMDCTVTLELAALRHRRLSPYPDAYASSQHHWIAALSGQVPLLSTARIALNTMMNSEGQMLRMVLVD